MSTFQVFRLSVIKKETKKLGCINYQGRLNLSLMNNFFCDLIYSLNVHFSLKFPVAQYLILKQAPRSKIETDTASRVTKMKQNKHFSNNFLLSQSTNKMIYFN